MFDSQQYQALDLAAFWKRMFELSAAAMGQAQRANIKLATRSLEIMTGFYARLWGLSTEPPQVEDKRFSDEAWSENLAFDVMRQAYLATSEWLMDMTESLKDLDLALHRRAAFYTQQFADALSPANFAATNPVVLQETIRTGGANLVRGAQNLLADLQSGRISQIPAGSFEIGRDLAVTPGKIVYRNELIELIQYTPSTERVRAVPLLVIPPWINKYYVMDLRPKNSMFKYLVEDGFTLFAISWKNPDSSMRHLDWEDYMTLGPLTALDVIGDITRARRVNMVGYCVGGLLLEVTLAYLAAVGDQRANAATVFATHQDFTDVGDLAVFISDPEVRFLEWLMSASGGYLDGRNMAATFNMLRANDLLWRYVVNNYLLGRQPPALDLLFWNSDGTRVPEAVHSFLLRNFFLANKLGQPDAIKIKDVGINLRRITAPLYAVAANEDHIVPWKGAFKVRQAVSGPVRFVLAESGHIAGIINPPADNKRSYWTNDDATPDPDAWLAGATRYAGSWWGDWSAWLHKHSGRWVRSRPVGSARHPAIMDAPGSYVLEK